jgi:hypothetical protein
MRTVGSRTGPAGGSREQCPVESPGVVERERGNLPAVAEHRRLKRREFGGLGRHEHARDFAVDQFAPPRVPGGGPLAFSGLDGKDVCDGPGTDFEDGPTFRGEGQEELPNRVVAGVEINVLHGTAQQVPG